MSGTLTTGKLVLTNTTSNQDAFDRLRISTPDTLFELSHTIGKNHYIVDELLVGAGATSLYQSAESYVRMELGMGITGKVVRQTYEYIPYQPGKSKLMLFTGILETHGGITGIKSRIGCFDGADEKTFAPGTGNGCFFELDNKTLYTVIRLNNVDDRVQQSDWNFDKFDGNGPSGLTLTHSNFANALIFGIDQEWLGVGRVRFGFFINGTFHLGHSYNHSGIPSGNPIQAPYTKTAKLPIRYELNGMDTAPGTTADMTMICSTVLSEGGFDPIGLIFSQGITTGISFSTDETKPLLAIKIREEEPYNRKTLVLKSLSIYNETTNGLQWDLYLLNNDSSIIGGTWNNYDLNGSIAQINTSCTGINLTNAALVDSGYADLTSSSAFNFTRYLMSPLVNSNMAGRSRVLCLAGKRLGTKTPISYGALTWVEIV